MAIPGLKVVAPSTPADVVGLMASAVIRDPDPVIFCEHKALFATKGEVPDGEHVVPLGQAPIGASRDRLHDRRPRGDGPAGARGGRTAGGRGRHQRRGHRPAHASSRSMPRRSSGRSPGRAGCSRSRRIRGCCGWGAEIVSIVADEGFDSLDAPIVRITTPHVPLPSAASLEDLAVPSVERIVETVRRRLDGARSERDRARHHRRAPGHRPDGRGDGRAPGTGGLRRSSSTTGRPDRAQALAAELGARVVASPAEAAAAGRRRDHDGRRRRRGHGGVRRARRAARRRPARDRARST